MSPRFTHLAAILLLLTPMAMGGGVRAADPPWRERAADAPLQIVARCQSRYSQWEGGSIYSYSELSVLRTIVGTPGPTLVVRQRGGEVDGVGQRVSHVTPLEPGGIYLLFLRRDGAAWSPTATGVNPVVETSDGEQRVGAEPLEEILGQLGGVD
jgi:hypothetical protein